MKSEFEIRPPSHVEATIARRSLLLLSYIIESIGEANYRPRIIKIPMGAIDPMFVDSLPQETELYIDLLEKTNQQLSLWFNPYAIMVAVLTGLIAILAIGGTFLVYWVSKDYRDKARKERTRHRGELQAKQDEFFATLTSMTHDKLRLFDEQTLEKISAYEKEMKTATIDRANDIQVLIKRLKQQSVDVGTSSIPRGNVIKPQSLDFFYWYGHDNNRYTFPSEDVFHSWFPPTDFRPTVLTCTDAQIADIPLSGNIVYRAGSRLIKTASDNKIYAVASNGIIRWIVDEALIEAMYGENWRERLVTLSDVLFMDYIVGASIMDATSFSPQNEMLLDRLM